MAYVTNAVGETKSTAANSDACLFTAVRPMRVEYVYLLRMLRWTRIFAQSLRYTVVLHEDFNQSLARAFCDENKGKIGSIFLSCGSFSVATEYIVFDHSFCPLQVEDYRCRCSVVSL